MAIFGRKPKTETKEKESVSETEMKEAEELIMNKIAPENEQINQIKQEISELEPDYLQVKEPIQEEPTEEELFNKFKSELQSIRTKKQSTKTVVRITAYEETDDNIMFGISKANLTEKTRDAVASLLIKELEIEHSGRELISIKNKEDGN